MTWAMRRVAPCCQIIAEANPVLYVGMSLALTFPFNILVDIPLYSAVARHWLG